MRNRSIPFVLAIALLSGSSSAGAQERLVFASSVTGSANLGIWPQAGAATGLAAGDAICRSLATAAGLADPNSFIAWLSDSQDDAYCRIHGFSGKKSNNCGQATRPAFAGPWVRVDGFPFAGDIERLLGPNREVFVPVLLDENGQLASSSGLDPLFTATNETGALSTFAGRGSCSDWSATPSEVTEGGKAHETADRFTEDRLVNCALETAGLLCMQAGAGAPLPPFPNPHNGIGARVFVTSASGSGDLSSWPQAGGQSGLAAGDAICRTLAADAALPKPTSFKAWLSDSTINAPDRLSFNGPWVRSDGIRVADDKTDLTDGELFSSINLDETGTYRTANSVYTGTAEDGNGTAVDCTDWTSSAGSATKGTATGSRFGDWTDLLAGSCAGGRLYCFSEAPSLFVDGFESGDTTAWTVIEP